MNWVAVGALLMGVGVMLGAFGAHGLRSRLDNYSLDVYERAVLYHYLHAIGILIAATLGRTGLLDSGKTAIVCSLLLAGIALFCGSLYALALSGNRLLGAVTPFGGVCFIAAWFLLAWYTIRPR